MFGSSYVNINREIASELIFFAYCISIEKKYLIKMFRTIVQYLSFLTIIYSYCNGEETDSISKQFLFYPKAFNCWQAKFIAGISVSNLPTSIVEEEISYSPMLIGNFRLGLPAGISLVLQMNSNYIATHGYLHLFYCFPIGKFNLAAGAKYSNWFGHLELDAIRLKSWGFILSPVISAGIDFDKFLVSAEFESQHSRLYTYSEDILLGIVSKPLAGFALRLAVEQPFWNDNWAILGIKLNYSKFYYQSWLSYSATDEFFLYPEIIFGFIL